MEKWLTIDEYLDTILSFLTALGSLGSMVVVYCGYKLAKKWKEQLILKSNLDEYYRYRESLFNELENLKLICESITANSVRATEIRSPRRILEELWRMIPKGSGIGFASLEQNEMIFVFFQRLVSNRAALKECISRIQTMLIFADIKLFSDLFGEIQSETWDLEDLTVYSRIGMVGFDLDEFSKELLSGKRGGLYNLRIESWEIGFCQKWLQSFFGEDYKSQSVFDSISEKIKLLQKAIIDYPKTKF